MRKLATAVGMLGMCTLAANGFAETVKPGTKPPGTTPQIAPPVVAGTPAPTLHIMSVKPVTATGYTGGPLSLEVVVENTGKVVATAHVYSEIPTTNPAGFLEQTVQVLAGSTAKLIFKDPVGFGTDAPCAPRPYGFKIAGLGGADNIARHATLTPTCSFTSKIVDPWNLAVPDRVEDAKKNKVYLTNAVLEHGPTCTMGVKFKGQVTNASAKAGTSVMLVGNVGDKIVAYSTAFALPVSSGKTVEANAAAGAVPASMDVKLFDPTKNLTTSIENQGITITTTRSCTLMSSLDPSDLAAPPR